MLILFLIGGGLLLSYLLFKLEERFFSKYLKLDEKYVMDFYDWYKKLCSYTIDSKIGKSIISHCDDMRTEIEDMICKWETETSKSIKFYKSIQYWSVFMKKNYQEEIDQRLKDLEDILHEIHLYKWKNSIK